MANLIWSILQAKLWSRTWTWSSAGRNEDGTCLPNDPERAYRKTVLSLQFLQNNIWKTYAYNNTNNIICRYSVTCLCNHWKQCRTNFRFCSIHSAGKEECGKLFPKRLQIVHKHRLPISILKWEGQFIRAIRIEFLWSGSSFLDVHCLHLSNDGPVSWSILAIQNRSYQVSYLFLGITALALTFVRVSQEWSYNSCSLTKCGSPPLNHGFSSDRLLSIGTRLIGTRNQQVLPCCLPIFSISC